jgi:hypothetical protein
LLVATFFSYQGIIPRAEYELLKLFVLNFKENYPEALIIILTDSKSAKYLKDIVGCTIEEHDIDPAKLLLCRTKIYLNLVKRNVGKRLLLVDYDIFPFIKIDWPSDIDLAYTIREKAKRQPINGGVILVNSSEKSVKYFEDLVSSFENLSNDDHRWWGDQIAVWSLISSSKREDDIIYYKDLKIKIFDSELYNWTPHDMQVEEKVLEDNFFLTLTDTAEYKNKVFVHFKGPRKHLMNQYVSLEAREIKNSLNDKVYKTDLTFLIYGFSTIHELKTKILSGLKENNYPDLTFKIASFTYIENIDDLVEEFGVEISNLTNSKKNKLNIKEIINLNSRYFSIVNLEILDIDIDWYILAINEPWRNGVASLRYGAVSLGGEKYLPRASVPISTSSYEFGSQLFHNWIPENSIFSSSPLLAISEKFQELNASQIFLLISALYRISYMPGVMGHYTKLTGQFNRLDAQEITEIRSYKLLAFRQYAIVDLYLLYSRYGVDISKVLLEIIQNNKKSPSINGVNFWEFADLIVEFYQLVKLSKLATKKDKIKVLHYNEILDIYSQFSDFRYKVCAGISYKTDVM